FRRSRLVCFRGGYRSLASGLSVGRFSRRRRFVHARELCAGRQRAGCGRRVERRAGPDAETGAPGAQPGDDPLGLAAPPRARVGHEGIQRGRATAGRRPGGRERLSSAPRIRAPERVVVSAMEISTGRHVRSVLRAARSKTGKLVLGGGSAILALGLLAFAALRFDSTPWSLSHADPALLAASVVLFLLAYGLKAYGWKRLFLAGERPRALALAAANGGASVMGVALPGRFDDAVRIAIVRRCPGCRVGVRALCLSLFMLGLIDAAALVPFASVAAAFSGQAILVRVGLALVAGA